MLAIHIGGKPLVLSAGTQAAIEHLSHTLNDDVADDLSLPFEIPIAGNEITLNWSHLRDLGERTIKWDNAELHHNGIHLRSGVLFLEGASEGSAKVTFSCDGLVSLMKGVRLRDLNLGDTIEFADLLVEAEAANNTSYPTKPYCFPMYFNPALYGGENEDWYPAAEKYKAGTAYAVDDLVTWEDRTGTVRRTWTYQCLIAHTTPHQSPGTPGTTYWQRVAFGIVNHWKPSGDEFGVNTSAGNYYAMVPWFYLKHILTKAFESLGYILRGQFMDDPKTDQRVIVNNRPLDDIPIGEYFYVGDDGQYTLTGTDFTQFSLIANDETTHPYEDTNALWASDTYTQPLLPAGSSVFVLHIKGHIQFSTAKALRIHIVNTATIDGSDPINGLSHPSIDIELTPATDHVFDHYELVSILEGASTQTIRTGHTYKFTLQDPGAPAGASYDATVLELTIQRWTVADIGDGWTSGSEPDPINQFSLSITPVNHVPDMDLDEFFYAVCDAHGIRYHADTLNRTITLDYKTRALSAPVRNRGYRQASPDELEIRHAHRRIILGWEDGLVPRTDGMEDLGTVDSDFDLEPPTTVEQCIRVRNSHHFLVSRPWIDGFFWTFKSVYLDTITYGDGPDEERYGMALAPVAMTHVSVQGNLCLVPHVEALGESRFFNSGGDGTLLRMANYEGMDDGYPFATAYGLTINGDAADSDTLELVDGYAAAHHNAHRKLAVSPEAVVMDMEFDHAYLMSREYDFPIYHGMNKYAIERIPTNYGTADKLLAKGVRLIRLLS